MDKASTVAQVYEEIENDKFQVELWIRQRGTINFEMCSLLTKIYLHDASAFMCTIIS